MKCPVCNDENLVMTDRQEERYKPQGHSGKHGYQKNKKSILDELFDF